MSQLFVERLCELTTASFKGRTYMHRVPAWRRRALDQIGDPYFQRMDALSRVYSTWKYGSARAAISEMSVLGPAEGEQAELATWWTDLLLGTLLHSAGEPAAAAAVLKRCPSPIHATSAQQAMDNLHRDHHPSDLQNLVTRTFSSERWSSGSISASERAKS